jgi:uncharacterized SAM-binding protein YcdF (DUF218 family)
MSSLTRHHSEPLLTEDQIALLTRIVFLDPVDPVPCDLIYIFGGTHPGAWETGAKAYHSGLGARIFVTGGISATPKMPHTSWVGKERLIPQCQRIAGHLIRLGVPEHVISCDDQPSNTYEESLAVRAITETHPDIRSILFISKCFGAGRQYRTLKKQLAGHITLIPYPFETNPGEGDPVTRENWMLTPSGRVIVLAEYQRICTYAYWGHVVPVDEPVPGLE